MRQVPDDIAVLPISDPRLLLNKRGKEYGPSLIYAQGSWIIEMLPTGEVETAQRAGQIKNDGSADLDWFLNTFFPNCMQLPATYLPGEYHPRIHRSEWPFLELLGGALDQAFDDERRSHRSFLVAYSTLILGVERIFRVVEPTSANLNAYGHEIRQALILASTEVEAAWRGVLVANDYTSNGGTRFKTNDYVKLLRPMRLDQWTVRLRFHPEIQLTPFAGWMAASPTQSLSWYDAYNAVKHDRETALHRASLGKLLDAIAAVNVLGRAQFGEEALEGVSVPDIVTFDLVTKPQWQPEEIYFKSMKPLPKKTTIIVSANDTRDQEMWSRLCRHSVRSNECLFGGTARWQSRSPDRQWLCLRPSKERSVLRCCVPWSSEAA